MHRARPTLVHAQPERDFVLSTPSMLVERIVLENKLRLRAAAKAGWQGFNLPYHCHSKPRPTDPTSLL